MLEGQNRSLFVWLTDRLAIRLRQGTRMPACGAIWRATCCLVYTFLFTVSFGQMTEAQARPARFEIASGFHPADPLFGAQLGALMKTLKAASMKGIRLRTSRKAIGASSGQMLALIKRGSLDGALIDPTSLGMRPALAQVLGGLPFGPAAQEIKAWAARPAGRETLQQAFSTIGAHPIICGHSERTSAVFAREELPQPVQPHLLTLHVKGLAEETYQALGFLTRKLPPADLYMGYATGVADLLVSNNPAMAARAGFAQVSSYLYYPSWETTSAFALLLIGLEPWQAYSSANRAVIETACQALNKAPAPLHADSTLADIRSQGPGGTVVTPWPEAVVENARASWRATASKLVARHPALAPVFQALDVPVSSP
ncbi:MAG: hypothetical protein AB8C46_06705 [Burkholderiaceae bacterium]